MIFCSVGKIIIVGDFFCVYRLLNDVKWADGVDLSTLVPSGV